MTKPALGDVLDYIVVATSRLNILTLIRSGYDKFWLSTVEELLDASIEIRKTPQSNSGGCTVEIPERRIGLIVAVVWRSFGDEAVPSK